MAPKRKRLDANGCQACNGKQKMKPDDCFRELTRIGRAWDAYVTTVIVERDGERCCVLKCKGTGCSAELSCANPSGGVAEHRAICKGSLPRRSPRDHGANGSRVSDEAGGSAEPVRRQLSRALQSESWQSNLEDFTIKPAQQKQFNKQFALYLHHNQRDAFPACQQPVLAQCYAHPRGSDARREGLPNPPAQ
jgi:hypothetical protein